MTTESVQALYVLARRANSLVPALALVLDVSGTQVSPDALEELPACSGAAHLPVRINPPRSGNTVQGRLFSVLCLWGFGMGTAGGSEGQVVGEAGRVGDDVGQ